MRKYARGFTLIELVLYMGILAMLLTVLSSMFSSVVSTQIASKATSSVDQVGRYLLAKLSYDSRSSSAILIPATPGANTNTLQITRNSINYTYSLDSNNNLQVINNSTGEANLLNGYDTQVTNLQFFRIGSGANTDTVQVMFTIRSRIIQANGQESRNFQTTLGKL